MGRGAVCILHVPVVSSILISHNSSCLDLAVRDIRDKRICNLASPHPVLSSEETKMNQHSIGDGIIVAAIVAAFVAYFYLKNKTRLRRLEVIHQERLAAMDKGI